MKIKFHRPETGAMITDLENKIVEIFLHLHKEFGGANGTNETLFKMFDYSFPQATEEERKAFTKLQGALRTINKIVENNSTGIELLIEEQKEYESLL